MRLCSRALVRGDKKREILLTYLVARFMRFLEPHPPLIVQFDGHAAAAIRVFADPAEELLEFSPQSGVLLAGLGFTGAAQQTIWGRQGWEEGRVRKRGCREHIRGTCY